MKPPTRTVVIGVALAVGLPLLAWVGTFLYWQVRITRAIRGIETRKLWPTGMDGIDRPELETLRDAGCRSIPYLFRELESSQDDAVLANARHVILEHLNIPFAVPEFRASHPREERRANLQPLAQSWEEQRRRHAPWWRVWSSRCGP